MEKCFIPWNFVASKTSVPPRESYQVFKLILNLKDAQSLQLRITEVGTNDTEDKPEQNTSVYLLRESWPVWQKFEIYITSISKII